MFGFLEKFFGEKGTEFHSNDGDATMVYDGKDFVVKKGSFINVPKGEIKDKQLSSIFAEHASKVSPNGILKEDVKLPSSFQSACFASGRRISGHDFWKTKDGRFLREFLEK